MISTFLNEKGVMEKKKKELQKHLQQSILGPRGPT
jgi:hypothetical protein